MPIVLAPLGHLAETTSNLRVAGEVAAWIEASQTSKEKILEERLKTGNQAPIKL